jgi:hypothetical protein
MPDTEDQPGATSSVPVSSLADDQNARVVGLALFAMVVALVVALIVISGAANPSVELTLFGGTITHDQVLLLGVLTAGALGGCIHVVTSFSDYVGNAQYRASWQWWYLMRPFIGGCLSAAFYFLLRGGMLSLASPGADPQQSPSFYGVTAIAFLVGMFSKQATDKLDDVFDTLFKSNKDAERKDGLDTSKPVLTALNPPSAPPVAADQVVELQGSGFVAGAQVRVNAKPRAATGDVTATSIKVTLAATEMANPGDIKLAVANPDGGVSGELVFSVQDRRVQPGTPDDRGAGAGQGAAGSQQGAPAGDQQAPAAGDQQAAPPADQQVAPAGDQQAAPAGDQQVTPVADQQAAPAAGQNAAPAGDQQPASTGDQQGAAPVGAGATQGVGSGMGVDGENADGTSG